MSRETVALALTFILACASATFFLLLRCEGKGRAFGPRSRHWSVLVIVLTSMLSAGGAAGLAVLGRYVPGGDHEPGHRRARQPVPGTDTRRNP